MLRQKLSQKLLQKLSPQQIQLMKLLQVPTDQLEQRIKEELEINPALEVSADDSEEPQEDIFSDKNEEEESIKEEKDNNEEIDLTDYLEDDDYADYKTRGDSYDDDDENNRTVPIPVLETFHENLTKQVGMVDCDDRQQSIAKQIIGSIDDDGYLRREISAIVDDLAFSQNIITTEEEILELLDVVQGFDPPGVGARDLRECLLLQLERKIHTKNVKRAITVIEEYFDEFTKKHYDKLARQMKLEESELKIVLDEILKLNPKPGGSVKDNNSSFNQFIIPDFTIINNTGTLELRLNSRNAPDLRISQDFKVMMQDYKAGDKKDKKQREAVQFIKQKLDSAKWFIDAIRQRQNTLYNTMYQIMEHQYDFFLTGDETRMKPMILKDIAEVTGLDISTVSRVANSKYVSTEFGTFSLKFFFSESLTNDAGEEVSTREVKKILDDLINLEDKKSPMSDQELTEQLHEKGYNIARRTVAKYREQLDIPVARLRREL
ncbi:MAG: RNA polymerase factor sigma-54 [Chitinophagales bacterium]|nr:RNA polymerase factor sigma-54 [Bacteroidota bacterium]MBP7400808.1 RNA polymerase factor sigma-54 [Chitinophagales bacterium]MBP8754411.1 RNA polymerase factor sigma-54 [Chitinophagales bacterium]MBP9190875.1 RNA polymerase factor sigma-54 [Chitinophagales bacterium]MBP9548055.1 RNA polymerase factor sigma-54 [Chitinophagales bacterium]